MDAVQRRRKLHLIWRLSGDVVVRRRVVVDLAQRDPVASPSALERPAVHVVDDNPLVEEPVGDEDLARILVELEGSDSWREDRDLLVVLLHLVRGDLRSAMPEI